MTAEKLPEDSGGTYNPDAQLIIGPDGNITEVLSISETMEAVGTVGEDTQISPTSNN